MKHLETNQHFKNKNVLVKKSWISQLDLTRKIEILHGRKENIPSQWMGDMQLFVKYIKPPSKKKKKKKNFDNCQRAGFSHMNTRFGCLISFSTV